MHGSAARLTIGCGAADLPRYDGNLKGNCEMTTENDNENGVSPQQSIKTRLWMVVMALALLRPCATIYHSFAGLAFGTPARFVFDV